MGMTANFLRIDAATLDALMADPERATGFLLPDGDPEYPADSHLDLDKSWHLVHFFLTGEVGNAPPPPGLAVMGGDVLMEEELGYGPPTFVSAPEVKIVAAALAKIDASSLPDRYDLRPVHDDVYLAQAYAGSAEDREYVVENFRALQEFYAAAAQHDHAAVVYLL